MALAACALALGLLCTPGAGVRGQGAPSPVAQTFDQPIADARSPRNANYTLEATLDVVRRRVTGRGRIRWRNISGNATADLRLHLYWNAWRDGNSSWMRERALAGAPIQRDDDTRGAIDLESLRVRRADEADGAWHDVLPGARFLAPDDGNVLDRTLLGVDLPDPLAPGETLEIDVAWTSQVPRTVARTGYRGNYYFVAHWFPKIGVLEDQGWVAHQFHAATEFYADFGVYDVRLTLPSTFMVGASGAEITRTPGPDGTTTHRYRGEDLHDFAWAASPDFVERRETFSSPGLPSVEMRLLLQPDHGGQAARYFAAMAAALRYQGEWFLPYAYDRITIVDPAFGSRTGGMEYPMLITAGTRWWQPEASRELEDVTVHEAMHQLWQGVVASNEVEHAWMDEGLATYTTARILEEAFPPAHPVVRLFGGFVPIPIRAVTLQRETDGNRLPGYRLAPDRDVPAAPTFRAWPTTAGIVSYNKTALWLHTLERHVGWDVVRQMLRTYAERWRFRHPYPEDFFAVATEVAGRDLSWFFDQVYRSTRIFDYGVQALASSPVDVAAANANEAASPPAGPYRTVVVVRRFGEGVFPVEVVTTFDDGYSATEQWTGAEPWTAYEYVRAARAASVTVDPRHVLLLDVNRTNNTMTMAPRAREAATAWSLRWLVWLQDLLLTYGLLT